MAEKYDNPVPMYNPLLEPNVVYAHDAKQNAKHAQAGYSEHYIPNTNMQTLYKSDHSTPPQQFKQADIAAALQQGWQEKPVAYIPPVINMTEDRKTDALAEENKALRDELRELRSMVREIAANQKPAPEEEEHRGPGRPRKSA